MTSDKIGINEAMIQKKAIACMRQGRFLIRWSMEHTGVTIKITHQQHREMIQVKGSKLQKDQGTALEPCFCAFRIQMHIQMAELFARLTPTEPCPGSSTNVGAFPATRPLLRRWTQPEAAAIQEIQTGRVPENGIVVEACFLHRGWPQNPLILAKPLLVGRQIPAHEFLKANEIGSRAFNQGEREWGPMFPSIRAIPMRDRSTDIESHDPKGHHEALRTLRSKKSSLAAFERLPVFGSLDVLALRHRIPQTR